MRITTTARVVIAAGLTALTIAACEWTEPPPEPTPTPVIALGDEGRQLRMERQRRAYWERANPAPTATPWPASRCAAATIAECQ